MKKLGELKYGKPIINIECLGGGSYGLAFKAGYSDGHIEVVKAFKVAGMGKDEADALRLLRTASPIKIPEVFYLHYADDELPFDALGMEYIEGVNVLSHSGFLFKSRRVKRRFADAIADALGEIHSKIGNGYGFINGKKNETWYEFYSDFFNQIFFEAKALKDTKKLSPRLFEYLSVAADNFDYIFDKEPENPVLLHGDLNVMNIMADKRALTVTGIIDPFNSMWGDREYDLFQLKSLTGPFFGLYEAYQKKFKTSEKCNLKCAVYALANEIHCYAKSGWKSDSLNAILAKRAAREYGKHKLI
jgi:aminoglycoside phosphotransferase (APT) family kinase protein